MADGRKMKTNKQCSPCSPTLKPRRDSTVIRVLGSNDPNHLEATFVPERSFSKCRTLYSTEDGGVWKWDGEKFVKTGTGPSTSIESNQESELLCKNPSAFPDQIMNVDNGNDPNHGSVFFEYDECKKSKNLKFKMKDGSIWQWNGEKYVNIIESDCPSVGVFNGLDPNLLTRSLLAEDVTLSSEGSSSSSDPSSLFNPSRCVGSPKIEWEADDESRWKWNPQLRLYEKVKEGVLCDVHYIRGAFNPNSSKAIFLPAFCKKDPDCIWLSDYGKTQWRWNPEKKKFVLNRDVGCIYRYVDFEGLPPYSASDYKIYDDSSFQNVQTPKHCLNERLKDATGLRDERFAYILKSPSGSLFPAVYDKREEEYGDFRRSLPGTYPNRLDPVELAEFCQSLWLDVEAIKDPPKPYTWFEACYKIPKTLVRDWNSWTSDFYEYNPTSDKYELQLTCPGEIVLKNCDVPYSNECETDVHERCQLSVDQIYVIEKTGKRYLWSQRDGIWLDVDSPEEIALSCARSDLQLMFPETGVGEPKVGLSICAKNKNVLYRHSKTNEFYEYDGTNYVKLDMPPYFYKDPDVCFDPYDTSKPIHPISLSRHLMNKNIPFVFHYKNKMFLQDTTKIVPHDKHDSQCEELEFLLVNANSIDDDTGFFIPTECHDAIVDKGGDFWFSFKGTSYWGEFNDDGLLEYGEQSDE